MPRHSLFRSTPVLLIAGLVINSFGSMPIEAGKPAAKGGGPSYDVIKLDDLNGIVEGFAYDVNDSRLVVGVAQDSLSNTQAACCWNIVKTKRTFQSTLQLLNGSDFVQSTAYGCNEAGEIVGSGLDTGGNAFATYWANSNALVQSLLGLPDSFSCSASAISNDGVICGTSVTAVGEKTSAILWRVTSNGVWGPVKLEVLDPDPLGVNYVVANDVNDQDANGVITIVGHSNGNAVEWTVTLSNDGGLLEGPSTILSSEAEIQAVNNFGIACGNAAFAPNIATAWIDGTPMILDPGRSLYSAIPHDVNDSGVIVGESGIDSEAVLWTSPFDEMISLNKFLKNSLFRKLITAEAVSNSGDIVGYGLLDELGTHSAFMAIPK